MLRAFAWLVSNVASFFESFSNRTTRDWHTGAVSEDQLQTSTDTHAPTSILRDDRRFASIPQDEAGGRVIKKGTPRHKRETTQALILRDREAIVSEDRGVLTVLSTKVPGTALSPLIPTNVGTQGRRRTLFRLAASSLRPHQKPFLDSDVRRNERFTLREISLN